MNTLLTTLQSMKGKRFLFRGNTIRVEYFSINEERGRVFITLSDGRVYAPLVEDAKAFLQKWKPIEGPDPMAAEQPLRKPRTKGVEKVTISAWGPASLRNSLEDMARQSGMSFPAYLIMILEHHVSTYLPG